MGDANAASVGGSDDEIDPAEIRKTMLGAPLWARAATVAAGPAFNFALSIIVFAGILAFRGIAADPLTIDELRPVPGVESQLQVGDEVLSIAGVQTPEVEQFNDFIDELPVAPVLEYRLDRNGQEITVNAPHPYPAVVSGLTPGSAAMDAGLQQGDMILSIDGEAMNAFSDLRRTVGASDGRALLLRVWRDGEEFDLTLVPRSMDLPKEDGSFETRYLIGITGGLLFSPMTEAPGIGEAISYGANQTVFIIKSSLSGLYHMAAGAISSCNLRGPIGIAETSGAAASQGWTSFIWFITVLSTAVGLLNLFPIPVLDGGHLVFHAYEAVTGRPPSDGALRVLMGIGLALLLGLMVFALTNDLFCP